MSQIEKHTIWLAEGECPDCDAEWEGHASDVGEEMWNHERQTGHDPSITDEWKEEVTVNTRTGEEINRKVIHEN